MFILGRDCLCRRESPRLARFVSPLCWRCSGMTAGAVIFLALGWLFGLPFPATSQFVVGGLCGLPAAVDVLRQIVGPYRSNSRRRLVTGLLLGGGIVLVCNGCLLFVHWLF